MPKKKSKIKKYECELCGNIGTHLFGFLACPKCEKMLRKHIKHYREYREKIEEEWRNHVKKNR
jgi:hypothetical protein